MLLSDRDILAYMDFGLDIEPFDKESQLQPASVDLRLGSKQFNLRNHVEQEGDELVFYPACHGNFYLAHTKEEVSIPSGLAASMWGRSSIGRKGLIIHTAGWIDPGFEGQLVLEIANFSDTPVRLPAGQRVCQLTFHEVSPPIEDYGEKEGSKYQDQRGIQQSRLENHGN